MTTYLVATLARYVLVDAANEDEARALGQVALHDLYADLRKRLGKDVPIIVRTIRPATDEEIDLQRYHDEMMAREAANRIGGDFSSDKSGYNVGG